MASTEIIDCTTCKYGYKDERLGIPLCHHPKRFSEDCVDFNMHEEKETEESEKPINLDDAMKELDEKIALVKQRGTWKGVDVEKYMYEVRGREPEKPMVLEEEVKRYYSDNFEYISSDQPTLSILTNIARHFAQWGYLRAAEKYNEIEYNRQRAEESVPNDLDKAARKAAVAPFNFDFDEEHLDEYPYSPIAEQKFKEGAKWQKGQMLKDAVEGEVIKDNRGNNVVRAGVFNKDFEYGDKIRIIVLSKED